MFFLIRKTVAFSCLMFLFACGGQSNSGEQEFEAKGAALAKKYCGNCHMPMGPEMLDKETWRKRVLPAMAGRLGIEIYHGDSYYQGSSSVISLSEWNQLLQYYDSLAPQKLPGASMKSRTVESSELFSVRKPEGDFTETAITTMVRYDSLSNHIFTSSANASDLTQWSTDLKKLSSLKLKSAAVDMIRGQAGRQLICSVGEMRAVDIPNGDVTAYDDHQMLGTIGAGFNRPIQLSKADFNKDGLEDYVVCSFGHEQGGLFLLQQEPSKTFRKVAVREVAGATQAVTGDFNQDGWIDMMVLFAHADEGIWLFENDRKGGFQERKLLGFPPVYGSSSFQLADMNNDGLPDIVYTAGDNSDHSRILKPYHGVYIFLNKGALQFTRHSFYPVNGSTKVVVADFNQDGLNDMAAIAFFGDLMHNPSETFLYFEQIKGGKSTPDFNIITPPISKFGRWICMDVADIDHDGDADIILGNFANGFINQSGLKPYWDKHIPFIVLENKTRTR